AFEQAAFFAPHPAPLLNAEEAWEKAGEPARAAEDCDRVLAMEDATPDFRAEAEKRLAALVPRIATIDFSGPRTIVVRIDGGANIEIPARRRVAPGRHALAFVDLTSSRSKVSEVTLARGETRAVDVTAPTPLPAPAPPPAPAPAPEPAPAP